MRETLLEEKYEKAAAKTDELLYETHTTTIHQMDEYQGYGIWMVYMCEICIYSIKEEKKNSTISTTNKWRGNTNYRRRCTSCWIFCRTRNRAYRWRRRISLESQTTRTLQNWSRKNNTTKQKRETILYRCRCRKRENSVAKCRRHGVLAKCSRDTPRRVFVQQIWKYYI